MPQPTFPRFEIQVTPGGGHITAIHLCRHRRERSRGEMWSRKMSAWEYHLRFSPDSHPKILVIFASYVEFACYFELLPANPNSCRYGMSPLTPCQVVCPSKESCMESVPYVVVNALDFGSPRHRSIVVSMAFLVQSCKTIPSM